MQCSYFRSFHWAFSITVLLILIISTGKWNNVWTLNKRIKPLWYHKLLNPCYWANYFVTRQSFNCRALGLTYTDSLLIAGEFAEDMVSMGGTDPHLREGCKFLRHLIQQSPHLQQKHHSHFSFKSFFFSKRSYKLCRSQAERTLGSSPLCSCAQNVVVGDTAPVWFDASPRTHQKPFLSHPTGITVWQRNRDGNDKRWSQIIK